METWSIGLVKNHQILASGNLCEIPDVSSSREAIPIYKHES